MNSSQAMPFQDPDKKSPYSAVTSPEFGLDQKSPRPGVNSPAFGLDQKSPQPGAYSPAFGLDKKSPQAGVSSPDFGSDQKSPLYGPEPVDASKSQLQPPLYTPTIPSPQPSPQLPAPIGLNAVYISSDSTAFKLHSTARPYCRGDYVVESSDGSRFLKADHKRWSYKRSLTDASGSNLYNVKFNSCKIPAVFYINDPTTNAHVATMKGTWNMKKCTANLLFTNLDGRELSLRVQATSWRNDRYEVRDGEDVVAYMGYTSASRKERKATGWGTTWDVYVKAGVDTALACAVAMGLDEYTVYANQMTLSAAGSAASSAGAGA